MKIAMSSIIKNEMSNIQEYLLKNKDVDYICLLDTGSTDGTWEYLQEQSQNNPKLIIQQKIYTPFNFSEARNDSFKIIPEDTDIVAMLDIDEYFTDANWIDIIKNNIEITGNRTYYSTLYIDGSNYSITEYPRACLTSRIVQTKKFKWYHCVHEIISDDNWNYLGYRPEEDVIWNKLCIIHKPNQEKDRTSYIDLCQQRIEENIPLICDKELEKIMSMRLLFFEYYRNNMFNEALDFYSTNLKDNEDAVFDCAACLYNITNNVNYLRDAISILSNKWYEQHLLYFALKYDFKYCKKYKSIILQKIAEHDSQIEERFRELDVLGNEIKQLAQKL